MSDHIRMRRHLDDALPPAIWPAGVRLLPLQRADPRALHTILTDAYANGFGSTAPFEDWWPKLSADTEFDPALVFVAADEVGQPIGVAQCWTSGFIKDLAVVPAWRGKGIGDALLYAVFAAFRHRGLGHVDLKVITANTSALRLYRRVGMVEAPL
ncbi:GNAT family N-acetyltransferase [Devosia lacusdianchii]|uniref:GNAT family N-acetyltransferase n=1 Tax=Devosia lacusdianchii TaxID=2917991 RepID=UPI001F069F75|nr:GNAT family N-acetyltransferase [Devosia sp. JXJ CY 41]